MAARLGQILINSHIITEGQLKEALDLQRREGGRIGTNLVKLGYVTEEKLVDFLSRQYNVPAINLSDYKIDHSLLKLIPVDMARKYLIMPVARVGATLTIAMVDPSNVFAIDDVKFRTGYNVEVVVTSESSIGDALSNYYMVNSDTLIASKGLAVEILQAKNYEVQDIDEDIEEGSLSLGEGLGEGDKFDEVVDKALDNIEVVEEREDAEVVRDVAPPIVKLVNGMLINGIKAGASDIHIEPYENSVRVRQRVDGSMYVVMNLPAKIKAAVSSRLKIMARLDIAERRLPQDGRIKLRLGKRGEIDFRVSTVPCLFGERVVLRILDKSNLQMDLMKLGFEGEAMQAFMNALNKPYGMLLVTGPTGSGKTTTLYSGLNYLNKVGINISTAEDPVEYNFQGINQVQVKEEIGLTFASALRSFLRQDPDVIMVGEIRDFETAEIAVKAALTGHLVLSTLHTNDAPSSISRLLNMGIEPFLVSASVILIMAQRLVRKVCTQCKEEEDIPAAALKKVGFLEDDTKALKCYRGKGCSVCNGSGYKGRIALYEVMPVGPEIKELVLEGASADEIKRTAVKLGMKTLRMTGTTKIKEGTTSVDEVLRVTFGD
jgi:type IV pilus assembly protein PilB